MRLTAAALAAALVTPVTGLADPAGPRCAIVGPLAVSSWFGLLETTGGADRDAARAAIGTLGDALALHRELGCDPAPLAAALDCISAAAMSGAMPGGPAQVAQGCMTEAGMPTP